MRFLIFALASFNFAIAAHADWRALTSDQFQLTPPPAEDSDEDRADLQTMLDNQETRAQKSCDFANAHFDYDFTAMWSGLLSPQEIQKAKPLLNDVYKTTANVVNAFKTKFKRPYSFVAHKEVKPCVPTTGGTTSFAYPSGHTSGGIVSACVLAMIYPQMADQIWQYGEYQGDLRVVMGRHYPTDVKGGKALGQAICKSLRKDPGFLSEVNALVN
jgi:acid phosphatase (class A)